MILVLHQEGWFYPLFPTRITMILVKDSLYLSLPTTIRIMVWASSKSYRNEQQNQDLPRHNTIQYNTIQCNLFWFSGRIPCCDPNRYALYSHIMVLQLTLSRSSSVSFSFLMRPWLFIACVQDTETTSLLVYHQDLLSMPQQESISSKFIHVKLMFYLIEN